MTVNHIIDQLDAEIEKLQRARALLASLEGRPTVHRGGTKREAKPQAKHAIKQKRRMSAAGRKKIAAAQKARWAKVKAAKTRKLKQTTAVKKSSGVPF